MAFDFSKITSKLNFFSKMGARARMATLAAGVVGVLVVMYLVVQYFSGDTGGTGASSVAGAPSDVQSVPGGQLSPEYYRALQEANQQAAEQAKASGGSAIPTLMNTGQGIQQSPTGNCNVICSDEDVSVKGMLDNYVRQGQLSPEVSAALQQLAEKQVSVEDYAAELDRLVREGKLTPEQARKLLEQYKKQHANQNLKDSAKAMDDMIKSGELPLDVANTLLAAQKNNMSPAEYAAELDRLVREGKLSKAAAQLLLAQYTQQKAKEVIARSVASLKAMGRNGELTPEVEKTLTDLENRMVPVSQYEDTLNKYVSSGKLIPLIANKILDEYKGQKAEIGPTGSINKMLQEAEAAAYGEINDLLKEGKMSQEVAVQLTDLIQKDVSLEDYTGVVTDLLKQGKIPPEIAKLKIADYKAVKGLREMSQSLSSLQGNDVTVAQYTAALQGAVQNGQLTPEQADQLLKEYMALKTAAAPAARPVAGDSDFAKLQQRLQQASADAGEPVKFEAPVSGAGQAPAAGTEFTEAQLAQQRQLEEQLSEERSAAIDAVANAMAGQAGQLINAWKPDPMQGKAGTPDTPKTTTEGSSTDAGSQKAGEGAADQTKPAGPVLIKAGTVLFAVLDTAVNSDYPDSPVMATVVDGKYKGTRLLGKLVVTKGVSGQLDRVMLNFTLMNKTEWDTSKTVTAFAIDPDTARTVLASNVDYHYLQRFGAIMATSFLQGYANAITTSSSTSTTGIFGTSTTHPELSPSQKLATALGQMGQALGTVTQNYANIPPTVKVNSGVGLGILFMSDVT